MAIQRRAVSSAKSNETKELSLSDTLSSLAIQFYTANREMNAFKKTAETARAKLFGLMKDNKKDSLEAVFDNDGTPATILAEISSKASNEVNIAKLRSLVGDDVFMGVVSATQSDVESICGTSILNQCLTQKAGKENVSVKLKK